MKNTFHNLLLLACLIVAGMQCMAQASPKAFFVHRNDGQFNAMFFSDVDSMVYSKIDTDSVVCGDYVTQEIWMPDTVVRIPIAAIDSVTFQTPANILKKEAVELDAGHRGWIEKVDSLTLFYSLQTPVYILPQVGNRLVTDETRDIFPNGFIGKVNSVTTENNYIVVKCDQLGTSDVYDRYCCVIEMECEQTPDGRMRVTRAYEDNEYILDPFNVEAELNFSREYKESEEIKFGYGFTAGFSLKTNGTLRYIYVDNELTKYTSFTLDSDHELQINAELFGFFTFEKEHEMVKVRIPPIPQIPFVLAYFTGGPRFEFTGKIALDFSRTDNYHSRYTFIYPFNKNTKNHLFTLDYTGGEHAIEKLAGNITVYGGAFFEVGLCFYDPDIAKAYGRADAGIELGINADISTSIDSAPFSTKLYDEGDGILSAKMDFRTGAALGAKVEWKLSDVLKFHPGVEISKMYRYKLLSTSLFPSFSETEFIREEGGMSYLKAKIDKAIICPVPVGFKIFDDNGQYVTTVDYNQSYNSPDSYTEFKVPYIFKEVNKKYKAYPVFKLFGEFEVLATPFVELVNELVPQTVGSGNIKTGSASIYGKLSPTNAVDPAWQAGFYYGESPTPSSNGTKVTSPLGSDGSFSATLSGLAANTTYYYCAYITVNGETLYGETLSFKTKKMAEEEVDLGLSVNWRGWNVGSTKPEEYGNYYAWGETAGKSNYTWATYFDNPYGADGTWQGCSVTTDIKATDKDAATAALGDKWRMPTQEEMQELVDKCSWTWETVNGVNGYTVTSTTNGNSIFLPAAGNGDGTEVNNKGMYGGYWTSTPNNDTSKATSSNLYFYGSSLHSMQYTNRYVGRSIRPVACR